MRLARPGSGRCANAKTTTWCHGDWDAAVARKRSGEGQTQVRPVVDPGCPPGGCFGASFRGEEVLTVAKQGIDYFVTTRTMLTGDDVAAKPDRASRYESESVPPVLTSFAFLSNAANKSHELFVKRLLLDRGLAGHNQLELKAKATQTSDLLLFKNLPPTPDCKTRKKQLLSILRRTRDIASNDHELPQTTTNHRKPFRSIHFFWKTRKTTTKFHPPAHCSQTKASAHCAWQRLSCLNAFLRTQRQAPRLNLARSLRKDQKFKTSWTQHSRNFTVFLCFAAFRVGSSITRDERAEACQVSVGNKDFEDVSFHVVFFIKKILEIQKKTRKMLLIFKSKRKQLIFKSKRKQDLRRNVLPTSQVPGKRQPRSQKMLFVKITPRKTFLITLQCALKPVRSRKTIFTRYTVAWQPQRRKTLAHDTSSSQSDWGGGSRDVAKQQHNMKTTIRNEKHYFSENIFSMFVETLWRI